MSSKNDSRRTHTVAFRLTLWYAASFGALALAVFAIFFLTLRSSLQRRIDADLLDDVSDTEILLRDDDLSRLTTIFAHEERPGESGKEFRLFLSPGLEVLASSDLTPWRRLNFKPALLGMLDSEQEVYRTVPLPGSPLEIRIVYKKKADGTIIEIGYSLEENAELLGLIRRTFLSVVVALLLTGIFLGRFIAKRAVSGVERVTQAAVSIGKGDLSRRVPVGNEGEEIRRLALAFNDMLERIQALVGQLKDVTNNIAHDLRSPITRIRGMAETTLTAHPGPEEYREMAGMVIEESDRLVEMIATMLDIAEAESGMSETPPLRVDMGCVVKDAYELFLPVAEDKGIRLAIDTPEEGVATRGDVARLQRVVANLLDNSIKYTPAGGEVLVSAHGTPDEVRIEVSDSGVGMDPAHLPHIFERFYRVDRSRSTPGSGLGLSLARAIVRAHGGEITVRSQPGQGSFFTVILPSFQLPV